LYDRLGAAMLRVARRMLPPAAAAEAEDAVQDVFVELVRRRDAMRRVIDLDAYLFAILRNGVRRRMERNAGERRRLLELSALGSVGIGPAAGSDDQLSAALANLPAEQREIVAMKIDGDLTFAQIAEILGIRLNTAASRYRYAMEKLRRDVERPT